MESCSEQIICTGIAHPFPDSFFYPGCWQFWKVSGKGWNIFKKNLPQIKSGKYVFSLKKGLRVTLYTARIITCEKLLSIAESFLYADSLELRLRVFLKEAVFTLRRIYRLSTGTVRNRDYFSPTAWLGWMMILVFSSTATHFLRSCQALPCSGAKEGATYRQWSILYPTVFQSKQCSL